MKVQILVTADIEYADGTPGYIGSLDSRRKQMARVSVKDAVTNALQFVSSSMGFNHPMSERAEIKIEACDVFKPVRSEPSQDGAPLFTAYSRNDLIEKLTDWMLEFQGNPRELTPEQRNQWHRDNGLICHFIRDHFAVEIKSEVSGQAPQ